MSAGTDDGSAGVALTAGVAGVCGVLGALMLTEAAAGAVEERELPPFLLFFGGGASSDSCKRITNRCSYFYSSFFQRNMKTCNRPYRQ